MPSRILRESLRTSPTLNAVSAEAERLFMRLIATVDDHGRYHGDCRLVLAAAFPLRVDVLTPATVEGWLQDLAAVDALRFYEVDGRRFLYLPGWPRHQRRPQSVSKFPAPPSVHDASTVLSPSTQPAPTPHGDGSMNGSPLRSRVSGIEDEVGGGRSRGDGQVNGDAHASVEGKRLAPEQRALIRERLLQLQEAPRSQRERLTTTMIGHLMRDFGCSESEARAALATVAEEMQ